MNNRATAHRLSPVFLILSALLSSCGDETVKSPGQFRLNVPSTVALSKSQPTLNITADEIDKNGNVIRSLPITMTLKTASGFQINDSTIRATKFPDAATVTVSSTSSVDASKTFSASFNVIAVDTMANTVLDNSSSSQLVNTTIQGNNEVSQVKTAAAVQVGQYYASATQHVVGKVTAVSNGTATVQEVPLQEVFKSFELYPTINTDTDTVPIGSGQNISLKSQAIVPKCTYDNGSASDLHIDGFDISAQWIESAHLLGKGIKFDVLGEKYIDTGVAAKVKLTTQLPAFTYKASAFASAHCTTSVPVAGLGISVDFPFIGTVSLGGLYDLTFDAKADASGRLVVSAGKIETTLGTGFIVSTIGSTVPSGTNVLSSVHIPGPLEATAKATVSLNPDIKFSIAGRIDDADASLSTTQLAFPTTVNFISLPLLQNSPALFTQDIKVSASGRAYSPMLSWLAKEFNHKTKWTGFGTNFNESGTLQDFGRTTVFATPKVENSVNCEAFEVSLVNQSEVPFRGEWIKEVQLFATDVNPVNGLLGLKLVKTLPGGGGHYTFKLSELGLPTGKTEFYPVIMTTYGGAIPLTATVISADRSTCPSNVQVKINSGDLVITEGDTVPLSATVTGTSDSRVRWSDRKIRWDIPSPPDNAIHSQDVVTPFVWPNTFSPSDTANPVTLVNQTPGEYTVYAYSLADTSKFATVKLKVNPWVNLKFAPVSGSSYLVTSPINVIADSPFDLTLRLNNIGRKTFSGTLELWFKGDCTTAIKPQTPDQPCSANIKPASILDWGNVAPGVSSNITFKGVSTSPDTPVPYIVAKDNSGKVNYIYPPQGTKINISY